MSIRHTGSNGFIGFSTTISSTVNELLMWYFIRSAFCVCWNSITQKKNHWWLFPSFKCVFDGPLSVIFFSFILCMSCMVFQFFFPVIHRNYSLPHNWSPVIITRWCKSKKKICSFPFAFGRTLGWICVINLFIPQIEWRMKPKQWWITDLTISSSSIKPNESLPRFGISMKTLTKRINLWLLEFVIVAQLSSKHRAHQHTRATGKTSINGFLVFSVQHCRLLYMPKTRRNSTNWTNEL